jgi:hypothetical protein
MSKGARPVSSPPSRRPGAFSIDSNALEPLARLHRLVDVTHSHYVPLRLLSLASRHLTC